MIGIVPHHQDRRLKSPIFMNYFSCLCSWMECSFFTAFLSSLNHRILGLAHFTVAWYILSSCFLSESEETNSSCF